MSDESQAIKESVSQSLAEKSPGHAKQLELEELQEIERAQFTEFAKDAYGLWIEELSTQIKEDLATKSITLLTCLSAYTDDPQNFMMKGRSSIGKTWNAINVVKYFPAEDVWLLGALSPTALVHDYGQLECGENYITQNLIENQEYQKGEPLDENWVWDRMDEWDNAYPEDDAESKSVHARERKKYLRIVKKEWKELPKKYVVDLSHKILLFLEAPHIDTFNRLRPILSHDAWEITYKFTDRGAKTGLATQTVTLRGWPATLFCTTDKTWMEDLATRSFTATPETTVKKLEASVQLLGRKMSRPWEFNDVDNSEFEGYVRALKNELLAGWTPIVPFGDELAALTKPTLGRDMRDFGHIGTIIKVMTLLHIYVRPTVEIAGRQYALATMGDFTNILKIWKDVEDTTRTGLTDEDLRLYRCLIKIERGNGFATLKDLVNRYNSEVAQKLSSKTAYKGLENLCEIGYVDKKKDDRSAKDDQGNRISGVDHRQNLYWTIKNPQNMISKAWEYFAGSFTEEKLENWFVDLLKYYSPNPIILKSFFDGKHQTNTLRLDDHGDIDGKNIIKNLFGEYYYQEPTEQESPPIPETEPEKYSPGETAIIQPISNVANAGLWEKKDWILGQLSFGAMSSHELAELSGMTLNEVDNIITKTMVHEVIRDPAGLWRRAT